MRRKSRIKFSPKLQSSSLDDIKRFVPKDALNTPVISSYNTLPVSETPYIDQSEFTNTNPSFGTFFNGPQQGRNQRSFGPAYKTPNPRFKHGGLHTDPTDPNKKKSTRNKEFLEDLDFANKHGGLQREGLQKALIKEPGMTVTLPDSARYNEIQKFFDYVNSSKIAHRDDTLQYNTNVDSFNELLSNSLLAKDLDTYAGKLNPVSSTPTTSFKNAEKLRKEIKRAEYQITNQFRGDPYYKSTILSEGRRAKRKINPIHLDYPVYKDPDTGEVVETTGAFSVAKAKMKGHNLLNRVNVNHNVYSKTKDPLMDPLMYNIKVDAPIEPSKEKETKTMAVPKMGIEERPVKKEDVKVTSEAGDIEMPGGTMTEEAFIKRYGQKVWDEQNRNSKYQNGGLPKYQTGERKDIYNGQYQGDSSANRFTAADGSKVSWDSLSAQGHSPEVIARNWNLTMGEGQPQTKAIPFQGVETRPQVQSESIINTPATRGQAFAQARKNGEGVFTWEGKQYTTEMAPTPTPTPTSSVSTTASPSASRSMTPTPTPISPTLNRRGPSGGISSGSPFDFALNGSGPGSGSPRNYSAPYENMSREQLEEHIKQSWTKSKPYGGTVFGARQTQNALTKGEHEKMGFEIPKRNSFMGNRLHPKETYVLEKNGEDPKAVSHLVNPRNNYIPIEAQEAANVLKKGRMELMYDEEIRKAAGQLDSIYSVSPTFNPMSLYDQTVRNMSYAISSPADALRNTYDGVVHDLSNMDMFDSKSDTITTPRPTRPTESTTIEFQNGGQLPKYQDGRRIKRYTDPSEFIKASKAAQDSAFAAHIQQNIFEDKVQSGDYNIYPPAKHSVADPAPIVDYAEAYDKALSKDEAEIAYGDLTTNEKLGNLNYKGINPVGYLQALNNSTTDPFTRIYPMYKPPVVTPVLAESMDSIPVKSPTQLQTRPLQENRLTPTVIDPIKSPYVDVQSNTAAGMPMIDTKARREGRIGNTHVPKGYINRGDNKGRIDVYRTGGTLPKYQNAGLEKKIEVKPFVTSDLKEATKRTRLYNDSLYNYDLSQQHKEAAINKGLTPSPNKGKASTRSRSYENRHTAVGLGFSDHFDKYKSFGESTDLTGNKEYKGISTRENKRDSIPNRMDALDYELYRYAPTVERTFGEIADVTSGVWALFANALSGNNLEVEGTNTTEHRYETVPQYKKPTQPVIYKPETDISESDFVTPGQLEFMFNSKKEDSKQKATITQTPEPSVIRPTITKVVKDSAGNIISTEEGISQKKAGKRFDPKTKTWKKYQNGGLHRYQQ